MALQKLQHQYTDPLRVSSLNVDGNLNVGGTITDGTEKTGSLTINGVPFVPSNYLTISTASSTYLTISNAASTYATIASPNFTGNINLTNGQIISTLAGTTTNNTGQIYLNGATSNRLDFNVNGVATPTFTNVSAGTKITLYPNIGASTVDYAIGIGSSTLWNSVPNSTAQFSWYAGTTAIMTLSGTGVLTANNLVENINTTAKTAAYQLTTTDANTLVQMNGAFAFQVDTSLATLPLGTKINLLALTSGVSVATTANAVIPTVYGTPGLKLRAQYSSATLIKLSAASASGTASTWLLVGDLSA